MMPGSLQQGIEPVDLDIQTALEDYLFMIYVYVCIDVLPSAL